MPNQKPCPKCAQPMHRQSKLCRACSVASPERRANLSKVRKGKPSYERTLAHRQATSARMKGKPKSYRPASERPEVAARIAAAWTPEMREAARIRGRQNAEDQEWRLRCGQPGQTSPTWQGGRKQIQYARGWTPRWKQKAWERAGGRCEICLGDKPCDTHHIDFRKDNHDLSNLQVLCRKCHKRLHAEHARLHRARAASSPLACA